MDTIFSCFGFSALSKRPVDHKTTAQQIMNIILSANNVLEARKKISDTVHTQSWTSDLAQALINGLIKAIEAGVQYGGAMKDALDKATAVAAELAHEAAGFAKEHPVYTTLIVLGICAIIAPWALEAVGFGALGPIEGTWAALWQSTYRGFVPVGSLFSFFQRLGMIWA